MSSVNKKVSGIMSEIMSKAPYEWEPTVCFSDPANNRNKIKIIIIYGLRKIGEIIYVDSYGNDHGVVEEVEYEGLEFDEKLNIIDCLLEILSYEMEMRENRSSPTSQIISAILIIIVISLCALV